MVSQNGYEAMGDESKSELGCEAVMAYDVKGNDYQSSTPARMLRPLRRVWRGSTSKHENDVT